VQIGPNSCCAIDRGCELDSCGEEMSRRQAGIQLAGVQQFRLGAMPRGVCCSGAAARPRDHRPTSVANPPGANSGAHPPISSAITRSAISPEVTDRSAEQRWPALVKAEVMTSSTTARHGASDHRRSLDAGRSGDERHDRAIAIGERGLMVAAVGSSP